MRKDRLPSVVPQLKKEQRIFKEFGPWQVDQWEDNQIVLQSHLSENDVALVINGDFRSLEDKYEYAIQLAARMNIGLRLIPPGFFDIFKDVEEYNKPVYKPEN